MRTWKTHSCTVHESDSMTLDVYNLNQEYIGTITPGNAQTYFEMTEDLDSGGCPISDRWFLMDDNLKVFLTPDGWRLQHDTL